jgi:hypothetical protein
MLARLALRHRRGGLGFRFRVEGLWFRVLVLGLDAVSENGRLKKGTTLMGADAPSPFDGCWRRPARHTRKILSGRATT